MLKIIFIVLLSNSNAYCQQLTYYKQVINNRIDTTQIKIFDSIDNQILKIEKQSEILSKFKRSKNRHYYIFNFIEKNGKTYVEFSKINTAYQYYQIINDTNTYYFGYTKKMGLVTLYSTKIKHNREEPCYKNLIEVLTFYNLPFEEQRKITENAKIKNIKFAAKKIYLLE
jgi:hypothetical protein